MRKNTAKTTLPMEKRQDSVARLREKKRRRKRKRRNQKIILTASVAILCGISFWLGRVTAPKAGMQGEKGGGNQTAMANVRQTKTLGTENVKGSGGKESGAMTASEMESYVREHPGEYPEFLRQFLESNPEAADFVYHYPENKNQTDQNLDLSGEYKEGEIPLFIQWDKRWGYGIYGDDLMALSGCGPACLSMVYVGLTGDTSMNPKAVAEFSEKNGYYLENVGTSWELMSLGAEQLGLSWSTPALYRDELFSHLDEGHPLICSMAPGDFTSTGHFIVIYGRKGENLLIHDPNSPARSSREWPYEQVESQIKSVWAYSKKEGTADFWRGVSKAQEPYE